MEHGMVPLIGKPNHERLLIRLSTNAPSFACTSASVYVMHTGWLGLYYEIKHALLSDPRRRIWQLEQDSIALHLVLGRGGAHDALRLEDRLRGRIKQCLRSDLLFHDLVDGRSFDALSGRNGDLTEGGQHLGLGHLEELVDILDSQTLSRDGRQHCSSAQRDLEAVTHP